MLQISSIESDVARYHGIVRGSIKRNLKLHIKRSEIFGRKGRDLVSIPVPEVEIPHFRFGDKGGVGMGPGEEGNAIGGREPGSEPGIPILEESEYAQLVIDALAEEVDLDIPPNKQGNIDTESSRQHELQDHPPGRRSFRPSFLHALQEVGPEIMNAKNPQESLEAIRKAGALAVARGHAKYLSSERFPKPVANAVTLDVLDTSGSTTQEKMDNARLVADGYDALVSLRYKRIAHRYFTHDVHLYETDRERQLHTRGSGGTDIGTVYEDLLTLIRHDYPNPDLIAVYVLHLTDAENGGRNEPVIQAVTERFLPRVERFAFGQLLGNPQEDLAVRMDALSKKEPRVRMAKMKNDDDLIPALKTFLGRRPNP